MQFGFCFPYTHDLPFIPLFPAIAEALLLRRHTGGNNRYSVARRLSSYDAIVLSGKVQGLL